MSSTEEDPSLLEKIKEMHYHFLNAQTELTREQIHQVVEELQHSTNTVRTFHGRTNSS